MCGGLAGPPGGERDARGADGAPGGDGAQGERRHHVHAPGDPGDGAPPADHSAAPGRRPPAGAPRGTARPLVGLPDADGQVAGVVLAGQDVPARDRPHAAGPGEAEGAVQPDLGKSPPGGGVGGVSLAHWGPAFHLFVSSVYFICYVFTFCYLCSVTSSAVTLTCM